MGSSLMEEDWVVLRQALYQSIKESIEMHETLKEVTRKIEVKKAGQRGKGLGKVAWRKTLKVTFLSARTGACFPQEISFA